MNASLLIVITLTAIQDALVGLVAQRVPATGLAWLEVAAGVQPEFDRAAFLDAFALATRRLSRAPLDVTPDEAGTLAAVGIEWPIGVWGVDDAGRAALLVSAAARLRASEFEGVLEDVHQHGDNRERQAVLRTLPLLPEPARFLPLAVDACRMHIQPLFEAVACENPYPEAHFPDLNFNQMVLKALFIGVPLARVVGLERRLTPELARMAGDYASERAAAGRSIPADIGLVTAGRGSPP